ncbi:hypothetical protein AZI86_03925 [Bdellovibrio bacteriovorus]|uniref:Uncharacterized protein n=1 Tax=Bdellovibrio bacteriovorus TaxID=959 RepID=A0A150WPJ3_BDEBC|nr:hypothetical protein [Bdellovibrio bacteriovorus]KYG66219.1 hypothetical protein AZI86_03925 [Bdellovibrio bacteriovorus]
MRSSKRASDESTRLRELIQEIGLPLRRLPDIIEEKPEDCLSWWSQLNNNIKITESHFERIAKFSGIDERNLFSSDYDRELARRRVHGDYLSLPERYAENQNSFLRTSAHIMRYVVLTRGQWFADQILISMNVSPLIYQNTDTLINLTYFADLLAALEKNGFSQQELDTLASVIFLTLQDTALGKKFQSAESLSDVYSVLDENFGYFDSNFEYKGSFVKNTYTLTTILPLNQHQNLIQGSKSFNFLFRYRHILLAWFPFLAGMPPRFPRTEISSKGDILKVTYVSDLDSKLKPRPKLLAL